MTNDARHNLDAMRLPALAIACGLALSTAWATFAPTINENRQRFEARQLLDIVGGEQASIRQIEPDVFAVSRRGSVDAWIFEIVTTEGYNGRIALWLGVDDDGVIEGVRVKSHGETPGLGDKIELAVSDWILGFNGYSTDTRDAAWDVERHGGEFDQFTGATITPRAVVHATERGLDHYATNRERWQETSNEL